MSFKGSFMVLEGLCEVSNSKRITFTKRVNLIIKEDERESRSVNTNIFLCICQSVYIY